MALTFFDGFDNYLPFDQNDMGLRWTVGGSVRPPGRFGGSALVCGNTNSGFGANASLVFTATSTLTCGFAFSTSQLIDGGLVAFYDASGPQVELRWNSGSGRLYVTTNNQASTLGTCSATAPLGAWVYIEIAVKVGTTGSVQVNVSGSTALSSTNVNTNPSGSGAVYALVMGGAGGSFVAFDDLYLRDDLTTMGELRVSTALPIGDGTNHAWTPSAGTSHFANVNSGNPSVETSWNATATVDAIDTFTFSQATGVGLNIVAVQATACLRKDDTQSHTAALEYRSNAGNDHTGDTITPLSSYKIYTQLYPTNPETGSPWTVVDLAGAEFGIKLLS